jgi:hypothetical protein
VVNSLLTDYDRTSSIKKSLGRWSCRKGTSWYPGIQDVLKLYHHTVVSRP